jgi:hypothetical protein
VEAPPLPCRKQIRTGRQEFTTHLALFLGHAGDVDKMTGGAGVDTFHFDVDIASRSAITDFKLGEDRLTFGGVIDGAGDDIQDLLDAGVTARATGSTLTIGWQGGAGQVTIAGWSGGAVDGVAALGWALGADLAAEP